MKSVIHVHQQEIRKNDPIDHPAIIVRTYKGSTHHNRVFISGPCWITHTSLPDACGARVVITTDSEVITDEN